MYLLPNILGPVHDNVAETDTAALHWLSVAGSERNFGSCEKYKETLNFKTAECLPLLFGRTQDPSLLWR
jgi:hypothetical protein